MMGEDTICVDISRTCFELEKNVQIQKNNFKEIVDSSLLHEREVTQFIKRNKRKKEEYLVGRHVAKILLARELNINYQDIFILNDVKGDKRGYPRLFIDNKQTEYSVSISHDKGIYFAGFSQHSIGVDVVINRKIVSDSSVLLDGSNNIDEFSIPVCFIWAIKESLTKALGIGLRYGINSVIISAIDLENSIMQLKLSKNVLSYIKNYSSISFKYEFTEEAIYMMCQLIK